MAHQTDDRVKREAPPTAVLKMSIFTEPPKDNEGSDDLESEVGSATSEVSSTTDWPHDGPDHAQPSVPEEHTLDDGYLPPIQSAAAANMMQDVTSPRDLSDQHCRYDHYKGDDCIAPAAAATRATMIP